MTYIPNLVHFQLTRKCNLRCWFCGQWGKKGFFADECGEELSFDDWKKVISSLMRSREDTGVSPSVMLWGGEPLMSSDFDRIAEYLKENDFETGMVTNGVLLDKHFETCKSAVSKIYVSIDGTKDIHNSIRGAGVFEKVIENLKQLKHNNVNVMAVLSEDLLDNLEDFPGVLTEINPKSLLLQDMIALSESEINQYALWLKSSFGMEAKEIYSWKMQLTEEYFEKRDKALKTVLKKKYPFPVIYLPHGENNGCCMSAFKHIHIAWNGNVLYCTDFYDFSAGNVKNGDVIEIFNNELSNKFREAIRRRDCPICLHCSWAGNKSFDL